MPKWWFIGDARAATSEAVQQNGGIKAIAVTSLCDLGLNGDHACVSGDRIVYNSQDLARHE